MLKSVQRDWPLQKLIALKVLRLLVDGESNSSIADKLYMSLRTVKGHIQYMREKTGFRNRTELAVCARVCGLVISTPKNIE